MEVTQETIKELDSLKHHLLPNDKSFASSLIDQFINKRKLSEKQIPYIASLLEKAKQIRDTAYRNETNQPESIVRTYIPGFKPLMALFCKVRDEKGIQEPKMFFQLPVEADKVPYSFRLKLGDRGGIVITCRVTEHTDKYRTFNYVGNVDPNGNFYYNRWAKQFGAANIAAILTEIQTDPSEFGKIHGKRLKYCCFCATELSTTDSLYYGYGPICAANFGLRWGDAAERIKEDARKEIVAELAGVDYTLAAANWTGKE